MQKKNINRELYQGTIWSVLDNFSRQAITFLVFVVLARILKPGMFGLLAVAILAVQVFRSVVFDSIATAIVRKQNPSDSDYNTGFWLCLSLSLPAFLILFILSSPLEKWIGAGGLAGVIRGTSFIILTAGLARMHEAWLTYNLNFRSLAIRSSVSVSLGGLAGITLAAKGYGIISLVAQQVTASISELVMLWLVTPWRPGFKASKKSLAEIVQYSKHVAITGLTNAANQNSDVFFVTYYLGSAASGFYSAGKRITNTLNFVISSALLRVSLPAFSRLQNRDDELQKAYLHSSALTAMVTAPLFVGLAVLSKDVILLILGAKWIGSVTVMQIVTIAGFLTSVGYYNQSVMLVKNKPQWQTRLTLLYAVTNIISFVIFARFGLTATALAFTIRALLLYPVSAWCALRLISLSWKEYFLALVPAVSASIIMCFVMAVISGFISGAPVAVRLFILVITAIVSYTSVIYFIMPFGYRLELIKMIRNKVLKLES